SVPGAIYCFLIVPNGTAGSNTVTINDHAGGSSTVSITTSAIPIVAQGDTIATNNYVEINLASFNLGDYTKILGIGFYWQTTTGWNSQDVEFYLVVPTTTQINYDPVS
ncbi:hypothetical protein ACI4BF_27750, partial [Klebsiella pneumoniae]|uniref:hypothetical protein n=1 Tax=Klebsiella pneumoniae TaxID=573 RepID=UPI00385250D9